MQDCRSMATPMITNWKKIDTSKDDDADPTLYKQLIESLMYLVNTRLDIRYVVNTLSQFMVEPKRAHWAAAKHVLRYIQGIIKHGLRYTQGNDKRLSGYTDADWVGSLAAEGGDLCWSRKIYCRNCKEISDGGL